MSQGQNLQHERGWVEQRQNRHLKSDKRIPNIAQQLGQTFWKIIDFASRQVFASHRVTPERSRIQ